MSETLEEYFARTDTPAPNSPVGRTMQRIIPKYPDMTLEEARVEAKRLLGKAAGAMNYHDPQVYSPEQREANRARLKALTVRPTA